MDNLLKLTATQARSALQNKEFTATELTSAYLQAADATSSLNNYVCMTADKALAMAAESDKRIADGSAGTLEGLPVGVKDLFCTRGVETTACSAILKGFVPEYESTVTSQLWRDGAVMLGKLNCDEFAMGSANETSVFGAAVNPWSAQGGADLAAGGSSGTGGRGIKCHPVLD